VWWQKGRRRSDGRDKLDWLGRCEGKEDPVRLDVRVLFFGELEDQRCWGSSKEGTMSFLLLSKYGGRQEADDGRGGRRRRRSKAEEYRRWNWRCSAHTAPQSLPQSQSKARQAQTARGWRVDLFALPSADEARQRPWLFPSTLPAAQSSEQEGIMLLLYLAIPETMDCAIQCLAQLVAMQLSHR
jgi:hypothetical protein